MDNLHKGLHDLHQLIVQKHGKKSDQPRCLECEGYSHVALGPYENMDEYIERFNELELTWFFEEDQPVLEYKPYNQGETKCLWLCAASALA
uniref:Uncharacterized protein n=1 Tax=Romanomermis culicivorax TaxID=13658 RepID=A0A915KTI4_ROMCU